MNEPEMDSNSRIISRLDFFDERFDEVDVEFFWRGGKDAETEALDI